jgi:hypothetical protein
LGVPFAKAAVRLFALFPIRKTTAKKSLFSKTGDTAAILDAKKGYHHEKLCNRKKAAAQDKFKVLR